MQAMLAIDDPLQPVLFLAGSFPVLLAVFLSMLLCSTPVLALGLILNALGRSRRERHKRKTS